VLLPALMRLVYERRSPVTATPSDAGLLTETAQ
jgi:hypothetical protein